MAVRRVASLLVVLIGWLYLVPQLQGAGADPDHPDRRARPGLGGLVVCVGRARAVAAGGMRSITFAQAFQFWLKFLALLVPVVVPALRLAWRRSPRRPAGNRPPSRRTTVVTWRRRNDRVPRPRPADTVDGRCSPVDGRRSTPGPHRLGAGTVGDLPARRRHPGLPTLPHRPTESGCAPRLGTAHPLVRSLSLILAICLGTMGLPHVLVRFYTNPDGRDTRRTTLVVIACCPRSTCCPRCSARSAGSTPPTCCSPATPTPPCCCCRSGCSPATGRACCSARSSTPAPSPRSCRRRRD